MLQTTRTPGEVTRILARLNEGDPSAWQELLLAVDGTLRRMARREMHGERGDHTLQATALIHEAFLRLHRSPSGFKNRGHFFGAASRAMQQALIESYRKRSADKRGGGADRLPLDEVEVGVEAREVTKAGRFEDLTRALEEMAASPMLARKLDVVRLLFLEGRSIPEAAEELGTSESTVGRDWRFARAWLFNRLRPR